jgi:CheY-like chemotaxis protein
MSQVILVVEDDELIQDMVTLILQNAGYTVVVAGSGADMYERLASTHVDLIILDLGLPDGDALPHILELRKESNIPVVILTGRQRIDDRLMALGLGADDYLTKPIDARELSLRVGNLLSRSSGQPRPAATMPTGNSPRSAPPPPPSSKPDIFMILVIVLLVVGAAAGVYYFMLPANQEQMDAPVTPVETVVVSEPVPEPVPEPEPAPVPEPVPVSAPPPDPEPVAEEPQIVEPIVEEPEAAALTKAEILGYGWILKSRCAPIPDVSWWKYRSHEDMASYVMRKKAGDWQAFVDDLVVRLAKLYDIAERGSSIVTDNQNVLKGESLKLYIGQFAQRLSIARCLAAEAKAARATQ